MPLKGVRYRVKTMPSGKRVRLAFRGGGQVVEAKNIDTGAKHTPAEFAAERKGRKARAGKKSGRRMLKSRLKDLIARRKKK